jgi:plasmid stability protein
MTMTVKLPSEMEQALRQRSAALGKSASEVLREALRSYLASAPATPPSAYAAGEDLFGKHAGPADLARDRKHAWAQLVEDKQAARGGGSGTASR